MAFHFEIRITETKPGRNGERYINYGRKRTPTTTIKAKQRNKLNEKNVL